MVVNCASISVKFDVFIGRQFNTPHHFGNPFTHVKNSSAFMKVDSREEAVICFEAWLRGEAFEDVEPERRKWMLEQLPSLKGKTLGCFCKPAQCHGDIIEQYIRETVK